jgi:hypothetical protein
MTSILSSVNWLAVFVASLSSFVIGAVWFGPKTFYPVWKKLLGQEIPAERVQMSGGETALMFGGTWLGGFIQALALWVIMAVIHALYGKASLLDGATYGFFFSVALGSFASLGHRMFGQPDFKIYKSLKVWLIESGQDVVALTVAGMILAAFQG